MTDTRTCQIDCFCGARMSMFEIQGASQMMECRRCKDRYVRLPPVEEPDPLEAYRQIDVDLEPERPRWTLGAMDWDGRRIAPDAFADAMTPKSYEPARRPGADVADAGSPDR